MIIVRRTIAVFFMLFAIAAVAEEVSPATAATIITLPEDVKELISNRCQPCHYELRIKPSLLLNTKKWFRLNGEHFEVERRIFVEDPPHAMPVQGLLHDSERALLRDWFTHLHQEL